MYGRRPITRSAFGGKRTLLLALQMSANDPKRTSSGRGHPWMDTKLRGRSFVPGAQEGKSGLNSHRPFGGIACFITTLIEKGPPSGTTAAPHQMNAASIGDTGTGR